ncbi:MAG: hypothetical protein IPN86_24425 [Saprospiraceae bacterium]|nr:hypothetical protein [Saprospiraceae bacterium]
MNLIQEIQENAQTPLTYSINAILDQTSLQTYGINTAKDLQQGETTLPKQRTRHSTEVYAKIVCVAHKVFQSFSKYH